MAIMHGVGTNSVALAPESRIAALALGVAISPCSRERKWPPGVG
jgi:hypothetical protein